ncbi:hypothetical protein [Deminuibacter soli]|uniref:Uncharacterized protein n=1 Tax=Deminuibacter soli TaxID=2291815 RepID=A0A3E1NJ14_9BACT|nr:hypothetical protein [Deminuibacter soli]RFM27925.1 hypothetical protein DXN05_10280 [Deminuibacter soli]
MLAPTWLLKEYAAKSPNGPQKWAYQTALANQSDLPFIASLRKIQDAVYVASGVVGVADLAISNGVIDVFGANGGYGLLGRDGLKIGNYRLDLMYANPSAGENAGTIFFLKQLEKGGAQFRWDYGVLHKSGEMGLHSTIRFHWNGVKYGSAAQRTWYPSSLKPPFFNTLK